MQPSAGQAFARRDEDACDNRPRYNVAGGNVAATGVAVDDAGDDSYSGGFSPEFQAPGDLLEQFAGGSQGFGANGGTGVLADAAGTDSYEVVTLSENEGGDGTWVRSAYTEQPEYTHHRRRGDGVTLLPIDAIDGDATDGETGTGGVFHDD